MMKMRRGDVMKIERARDRDLGDLGRLLPVTPDRHHRPTDELEGHLSKIEIAISEISGDCYPLLRDRHHRPTNISPDRARVGGDRATSEALFPSSRVDVFSNGRKMQPGPRSGSYIFLPGTAKMELIETMGR